MAFGDSVFEKGVQLVMAAANGSSGDVLAYLEAGADIHHQNDLPLRAAAMMGNFDIVTLLLDKGADIHAAHDETLLYAAKRNDRAIVEFLVERGADIQDMLKHHKGQVDAVCLETLDQVRSGKMRQAFEKNRQRLTENAPVRKINKIQPDRRL